MSSYQLASLVDVIKSGGRLSLSTSNGIPIPNRIILGHDTKQFTVGGSIVKTAYSGRPTLEITGNVFSGNASTYGISLGTIPSSATYIAIAESRIDCEKTSGIPFILNTRLSSESNFISIVLGNSYESAGSKNKINVGGGGTGASASQHLFVNGVKQASATLSNAPIQIGSIVTVGTSYSSIPGSSYTALAKADSTGGFAAPMRLYLFAEFPLLPETAVQRITANPGILFERRNKTYFLPSAAGGATALTVQGITQVHSLGSPALTQHNVLSPSAVAQLQALGQPTLTEHNLLVANAISQAQSLGAPSLTQHNLLAVDALGQAHVLGVPTLTQAHVLVVQGATQAQTLESPSLTQHNALTPDAMTQAQTLANVALTVAGSIVAADIAQGHSLGSPSLTQHHALEVAAMMQAHSLGNVDMTQAGTLSVQGLTQAQTLEAAALIQHHALVVQAILQTHSLGNVTLTASDALAVAGITQAQLLDAPALTQHNVLVVQGVTQAQILQLCTLGGLVIGSLAGTIVAYALIDGELVAYAALDGTVETVH